MRKKKKSTMQIRQHVSLKKMNTFRIGGKAKYFCQPGSKAELIEALQFAKNKHLPFYLLGGGANTLFGDDIIEAVIISTQKLNKIMMLDQHRILVQAGASMKKINRFLAKKSLSGLEFSGGLPGSIGGAVYMNARAYGHEISEIVESVTIINNSLEEVILKKDQLNYAYKQSIFMNQPDYIIIDITFQFQPEKKKAVLEAYKKNIKDRKTKGQYRYPSAGCIFKNNYQAGIPSGKIIDSVGLKNIRIGDACIYNKHANFIVNMGHAKAHDVLQLINMIESKVQEEKSIQLEREVRIILK
ncbi:MAG: UDP-N-acetylmuramate dehydrogenase [Spirochaetes bacterium]|nr:UDP-N-acetylmuramate dehydrogenase [Spirochaetota bacterium]